MRQMTVDTSRYEVRTRPIVEELGKKYQEEKIEAKTDRSVGGGTIVAAGVGAAAALVTGPVGWWAFWLAWSSVATVGANGTVLTVQAQERVGRANEMIKNLKKSKSTYRSERFPHIY